MEKRSHWCVSVNAHTNGRGFSLMCSLLFENTALYGEWVFHWVCKSRGKKDETEWSKNERASNYMTDLASGSLWLNRAPFPDITPQSFHKIIPLSHTHHIFLHRLWILCSSTCVYVCAYLCVQLPWLHQDYQFWDMILALVPCFLWAFCLGYITSRFIDPTKGMRPGMYVGPSFFTWILKGITGCLCQLLLLHSGSLFLGHWITKLTFCRRNFGLLHSGRTDSATLIPDSVGVRLHSVVYLQRDSSVRQ